MSNQNKLFVYRHIPSGMLVSAESPSGWCYGVPEGYKPFFGTEDDLNMEHEVALNLLSQEPASVERIPAPANLMNDS